MRDDKLRAITLRKKGHSYNQICQKLGVAKSTLSYWLRDVELTQSAKKKIYDRGYEKCIEALIKRNKRQTVLAEERAVEIKKKAEAEVVDFMENPLFLTGVSLYWAEGYKRGAYGSKWKCVDFANADPKMIRLIMRFFREVCKVNEEVIKIQLIVHPNIVVEEAIEYWEKVTRIPRKQFMKVCHSVSKASKGKRNKQALTYGTVHIRIYDVKMFYRIIGWIEGLQQNI